MPDYEHKLSLMLKTEVSVQLNAPYVNVVGTLTKAKFGGEYTVMAKGAQAVLCFEPSWIDRIVDDVIYLELKNVRD